MSKMRYSAEQLCHMYPKKYIAVNHICKDDNNVIIGAEILKVYEDMEQCKKFADEIKFFMKVYKTDFDIIYGDFADYLLNRAKCKVIEIPLDDYITINEKGEKVIDAFAKFGAIAFELFGDVSVDDIIKRIEDAKNDETQIIETE